MCRGRDNDGYFWRQVSKHMLRRIKKYHWRTLLLCSCYNIMSFYLVIFTTRYVLIPVPGIIL